MSASTDQYTFSNSAPEAVDQLATLEAYLDPVTTACLAEVGLRPGARCLEIGAGAGSVARWLADRAGPTGRVVTVDLDTSRLLPAENLEVYRHDVRQGLPVDGPFDLIHARLLLLHLPQRRQILRTLIDALAPGGWLVLGEFSREPLRVIAAPSDADAALFRRVIQALLRVLGEHGADLDWAWEAHVAMRDAGMVDVHSVEYAESWTGGGDGARLHYVNSLQKQAELVAAGLHPDELTRFRALTLDPRFSARSWQFVCTRGRAAH